MSRMKKSAWKIKKSVTIDDLAVMVAKGFESTGLEIKYVRDELRNTRDELRNTKEELKMEINELRDVVKATRRDVLDIGDRFVQRYEFNGLLTRVGKLEQRVEGKSK